MLNDILALDQLQWLFNQSDFPPISWPGYLATKMFNYKTSMQQLDFQSLYRNPYLVPTLAQSFCMLHVVI